MKTFNKFTISVILICVVSLHGSILRVISTSGNNIKAIALDNPTTAELGTVGEEYYAWSEEEKYHPTPPRYQIVSREGNVVTLSGSTPFSGSHLVDKDWLVVLKLIASGGNLETALAHLSQMNQSKSAFQSIQKMEYDDFKDYLNHILLSRINQVEKKISEGVKKSESSLGFLYFTMADTLFVLESDFKKAARWYEKALGLQLLPKNSEYIKRLRLGDCFLNLGETTLAIKTYMALEQDLKSNRVSISDPLFQKIDDRKNLLRSLSPKKEETQLTTSNSSREKIVQTAISLIDTSWQHNSTFKNKSFYFDCSGVVSRIYWEHNIDITHNYNDPAFKNKNGVYRIYHTYKSKTHTSKYPAAGDLLFFDNTFDANKDSLWNDELIHIGIVETVDNDGTISYIHHCSKGIKRYKMNLNHPKVYQDPKTGKVLNSFLRRPKAEDPKNSNYLSAGFFQSFATIIP